MNKFISQREATEVAACPAIPSDFLDARAEPPTRYMFFDDDDAVMAAKDGCNSICIERLDRVRRGDGSWQSGLCLDEICEIESHFHHGPVGKESGALALADASQFADNEGIDC